MLKITFTALITVALLTGCVFSPQFQSWKGQKKAKAIVNEDRGWDSEAAVYTSTPEPDLKPIPEFEGPDWLKRRLPVPLKVSNMPFDMVVDELLIGTNVVPQFDYEMQHDLKVSVDVDGTLNDALLALSARTNYSYTIQDNIISWQAYETKNFVLPVSGGDYSFMIGKTDQGAGGGANSSGGTSGGMQSTMDTSAFDVDLKQYSNTKATNVNHFADAEKTIASIVKGAGTVIPSPSTSSIMVKTTPDRMRVVSAYMDEMISGMLVQVALDVRVVQITTRDSADVGVNWKKIKEETNEQLSFFGDSAQALFTNAPPIGFSKNTQSSNGSVDILVNALQQQGSVSFLTNQHVLSGNGKVSELEMGDIKGYLQSSKVTSGTDIGTSRELVQGIIQAGYTLYTYTKVFGDRVALVISNRSSDLEPFQTVGSEDNFIQIPSMKSNRLHVSQIIKDGTTVVAASIRREKSSSEKQSPLSARFLPTYSGAANDVVDIYVLVTPRIVRNL